MKCPLALCTLVWIVPFCYSLQHRAPVLDLQSGNLDYYHGTIKRTDTIATINPEIRVLDGTGPICSYELSPLTSIDQGAIASADHNRTIVRRSIEDVAKKAASEQQRESSSELTESAEDDFDDDDDDDEADGKTTTVGPDGKRFEVPFRVDVIEQSSGKATIRLKDKTVLDCKSAEYAFKIAPKRCGDEKAGESATVNIRILESNDHDPQFEQSTYKIKVKEGRTYDSALKLIVSDADCGAYGRVCKYEIADNPGGQFELTKSGDLEITTPLKASTSPKRTLTIVAEDCGKRRSKPITVEIEVEPVCQLGLTTPTDRIEYGSEDGAKTIAAQIEVQLCDSDCTRTQDVQGKVRLGRLAHSDCDRESNDAKTLQSTCGADSATVDLLPDPRNVHAIIEDNSSMPSTTIVSPHDTSSSNESSIHSTNVYSFDGRKNAIVVPTDTASPHVPDTFSLAFWMRHDRPKPDPLHPDLKLHKIKENILCSSDDHRLNRHHFAVYIRNCKLELLIRRENPNTKGESEFQPAEWRWRIGQVCDNQWHHYSLNLKVPQLDLYVDGKPIQQTESNLEILDDWPMHEVHGVNTKLVVGACWHGGSGKMTQFFNGQLADMTYLPERVERSSVLPCSLQCKEQLDFTNLKRLKAGQEAVFNADMSELTLKAANISDYLDLLRKVSYSNHKSYPTPGERAVSISTSFTCVGAKSQKIDLPAKSVTVEVKKTADPVVTLEGTSKLAYLRADVEHGVALFPNVKIFFQGVNYGGMTLDSCKVNTTPGLNIVNEYFSSPATLIGSLNMKFVHVNDGLMLKGTEKAKSYEAVLQQIRYFNSRPTDLEQKKFTVQCFTMDGRVKSNQFTLEMRIQAALMGELKPSSDNQSGIEEDRRGGEEKMRLGAAVSTPTALPSSSSLSMEDGSTTAKDVANVISSDPSSTNPEQEKKTESLVDTSSNRPSPVQTSSTAEAHGRSMSEKKPKVSSSKVHSTPSMFEHRKNIPLLLLHDEPANRHHRLTLDKLAADAPRPSLGGPLPLLHQADIGDAYGSGAVAGTGSAVAVVIVVCVGFLLLLIVVGIIKIRSTHRRMMARQHRRVHRNSGGETGGAIVGGVAAAGDLAWDDAGMNITINPMEVLTAPAQPADTHDEDDYSDGSSDEDDDASFREDEECSEDEDDEHVLPHVSSLAASRNGSTDSNGVASTSGGLEWDDTTLSHSAAHNNLRTQTYRV